MKEYRCKKDGKLLLMGALVAADIEIKCRHCGEVNVFSGSEEDLKFMCHVYPCPHRVDGQGNPTPDALAGLSTETK